jgi:hypothetical protein
MLLHNICQVTTAVEELLNYTNRWNQPMTTFYSKHHSNGMGCIDYIYSCSQVAGGDEHKKHHVQAARGQLCWIPLGHD